MFRANEPVTKQTSVCIRSAVGPESTRGSSDFSFYRSFFTYRADWPLSLVPLSFFDGYLAADFWFWALIGVIWLATYLYPPDARAKLKTHFWAVKRLELLSCTAVFGLWMFVGNQMARHFEGGPDPRPRTDWVQMASVSRSRSDSEGQTKIDKKEERRFKRAYRAYFRNAVRRIKERHQAKDGLAMAANILIGVMVIGLGVIMLVCGIQCGGSGGLVALGVLGGLGLAGLGIWVVIAGIRKQTTAG